MKTESQPAPTQGVSSPNEKGGFYFSGHIVIKDPNTQQVLVNMRAD